MAPRRRDHRLVLAAFLTLHAACVALSARQIQRRAAKSVSGHTVEPPDAGDARRKATQKGRLKKPTGCVAALARCPTSRGARLLPCRLLEPAQATSSVKNAG